MLRTARERRQLSAEPHQRHGVIIRPAARPLVGHSAWKCTAVDAYVNQRFALLATASAPPLTYAGEHLVLDALAPPGRFLCPERSGTIHHSVQTLELTGYGSTLMLILGQKTAWYVGLTLGFIVVVVAVVIVAIILVLASRIARQAVDSREGVDTVRAQTVELPGIQRINDSGVRILHAARALRKVAVGH